MRIVILGGLGNYGLTLAGLSTQRGHDVLLLQFPGTVRRIPGAPQKNYEPHFVKQKIYTVSGQDFFEEEKFVIYFSIAFLVNT